MPSSTPDRSPGHRALLQKIADRTATAGVVGLGYVGLPLAHALHNGGLRVVGFDVDKTKVEMLEAGQAYLTHLGTELYETLAASDRFDATTDMGRLGEPDVVIVCLPTPLGRHNEPDLSYVESAGRDIGAVLRPGQLVILESTTYPGTTRREFWDAVVAANPVNASLGIGTDVFVAYSPEREDPGRSSHSTSTIPKLVGGLDDASGELAVALYRVGIADVVPVDNAEIAEAAKLLENIFRAVNIALVNEMKIVLTELGIDVWKVVEAAATKPFGFMPFFPGPGLGGHCIPIDPFYLSWRAREVGQPVHFIELAGELNGRMPGYVVDRLAHGLNDHGKPVRGSRVLVLGLAYKSDVGDTRESPSFELIELLMDRGATVDYHDPHVPEALPVRRHDLGMRSITLTEEAVAGYDAVLIATGHSTVDYALVARSAQLVVDTRNVMASHADQLGDRLVKA